MQFDAYEIQRVGEFYDPHGDRYCEVLAPDMDADPCDNDELSHVFWTLYGHIPGQGVDAIADRESKRLCAELYQRITGCELPDGFDPDSNDGCFCMPASDNKELEQTAGKLADLWIHLDSWARGEAPSLEFVQQAAASILRHQGCPNWKDKDDAADHTNGSDRSPEQSREPGV